VEIKFRVLETNIKHIFKVCKGILLMGQNYGSLGITEEVTSDMVLSGDFELKAGGHWLES
jgi:hypothetical protein